MKRRIGWILFIGYLCLNVTGVLYGQSSLELATFTAGGVENVITYPPAFEAEAGAFQGAMAHVLDVYNGLWGAAQEQNFRPTLKCLTKMRNFPRKPICTRHLL